MRLYKQDMLKEKKTHHGQCPGSIFIDTVHSMLEVICQDKNTISGGAICAIDDPSLPTLCWKNGYQELFKSNKLVVCGEMNTPIMCGESFGFVYTDAVGPIICHGQNGGNYIFEREQSMVKLDNFDEKTRLKLQLEDDEVADLLKICEKTDPLNP